MKIAQHDNSLETNIEVKSKKFKIGNTSKIIGILRNKLYEHKVRTLVQEYMSNARDAMREGRSNKHILVTVPNQLNPVFKVRDFGPGITPHRMETVFIAYGESTKDDSNDEAGGFGIGAKSAWAYNDSFTIISITGGKKRTYVAHIGTDKEGRLDEISCEPTDEPTGTEIHVAVKHGDIAQFRNAIYRACYFWRQDEYPEFKGVTAGEVPKRQPSIRVGDLELVNTLPDYLELDEIYYGDCVSMVIDGIPYKMGKQFIASVKPLLSLLKGIKCQALIHVGNGVMDIPATRESISTEQINVEILSKLAPTLKAGLAEYIKTEFSKAKSYSEWISTYGQLSKMLNVDDYAKRGDYSIKSDIVLSNTFKEFNMFEVGPGRRGGFKREPTATIDLEQVPRIFFIDDPGEPFVRQNRRMKDFLQKTGAKTLILVQASEISVMELPPIAKVPAGSKPGDGTSVQPQAVKKILTTITESEKSLTKFLKDFGGQPLSSLTYTPPVRAPREMRVKEKEEFTIHKHRYGKKNIYTTTLERVDERGDKYLYIEYSQWNKYKHEFGSMDNFVDGQGYKLCALTPQAIKKVAGNKHFKQYEAWWAAFKPSADLVSSVCANKAKNADKMRLLSQANVKIADPVLDAMLDCYKTILKSAPEGVPAQVLKFVSKEVEAFEKYDAALTKLLKDSYPLVGMIDRTGTVVANELVAYINSKV